MGHRKKSAPRRGSLAYLPRGRAARETPRIRFWSRISQGPTLLGFMGYKAGMTHLFYVEDRPRAPNFGKEINQAVTILEAPPILICGVRAYTRATNGLNTLTEAWMKSLPKDLERVFTLPENFDTEKGLQTIEASLTEIAELRIIAITQPRLSSIPKKKPEVVEIKVDGAPVKDLFEYVRGILGKTVSVNDVLKEGQFVDAIAVTKGKGFQGPVKRWGVKILPRKSRKTKRGIAVLGPWKPPRVLYTVPRAGQMGYHTRTEYNKRVLKIGMDGKDVNPKGGFVNYGLVKGPYIILNGSVPGPKKRLIRLRYPARPKMKAPLEPPKITQISIDSQQNA